MAIRKKKAGRVGRDGNAKRRKTSAGNPKKRLPRIAPTEEPMNQSSLPVEPPRGTVAVGESASGPEKRSSSFFPVVGIGASAGGVEAFTELLNHLPADTGMGFVFVQHLSPMHQSVLTEILSRTTSMPVTEIKDATTVESNHLYVIPPNAYLSISHGVLHLLPREEGQKHTNMPIDYFFKAMATDLSSRAIGVVLSGTASDGALGLKAIKSEGGITFAQDEGSAKYDGMPRSAVAAGYVDFVLPPDRIAAELARMGRHPYVQYVYPERETGLPTEVDDGLDRILITLRSATGVDFTYYKQSTIRRRILRRMLLQRIDRHRDYVKFLQAHPAEVQNLYNDILINVTGFFRDAETFDAMWQMVFPRIFDHHASQGPIRVWVPGCSTGEEAYSLVIAMLEYLGDRASQTAIQLFATDISEVALEKARAGIYPQTISADVSAERLRRFFTKLDGAYQIRKSIRDMCIFAKQNVYKDPPFSKLDLISCRNVLIYFGSVLHKKVIPIFHYALNPNGILVLGTSETIGAFLGLFSLVDKKYRFYQKRVTSQAELPEVNTAEYAMKEVKPERKSSPAREWKTFDIQKEVDRALLNRYAPAGVVIDDDLEIVQFRGRTSPFLEPASGEASLNILKMAREGLLFDLRSAVMKAKEGSKPIRREGLVVKENEHMHTVNLEVIPLRNRESREHFYLILFERGSLMGSSPAGKKGKKGRGKGETAMGPREAKHLKQELAATKEYLQSIIEEQEATNEELRSANEEIQSSNEELQSTNEELETAKEELQSTNEELNTVNEALESRNAELNQLNNDLMNLLNSVHVPIIMLGNDLRIRRFTPSAERLLNVIATDVGRKIMDIRPNLVLPDLEHIIVDVIDSLRTVEREVQDSNGYWYAMRVRPYKTLDNKIDGVVLVFFDINELKRIDDQRKLLNELGNSLMEVVGDPTLVIDSSLRVAKVNPAFVHAFNTPRERIEGEPFFELHERAWRTPEVQDFLGRALAGAQDLDGCEVHVDIPGLGSRDYTLMTRPVTRTDGSADMVLLIIKGKGENALAE